MCARDRKDHPVDARYREAYGFPSRDAIAPADFATSGWHDGRLMTLTDLLPADPDPDALFEAFTTWTAERGRRFYGFGESHDGAGVTIFALRLRDHMQLTASFDARSAEPAAVRAALADLAEPAEVLSAGR